MLSRLSSIGLTTRIIAISFSALLFMLVVNYVVFASMYRGAAETALLEQAAAFTAVADEAKNHTAALNNAAVFATDELLTDLAEDIEAGKSYRDSRIFNTIPVVAGWKSAQEAAEREGIDFRITSFDARNPDNEPKPGSFEAILLTDLEAQFASGGGATISRINEETEQLHYMRSIVLTEDCMLCHGHPSTSLTGDGKDILGFTLENWNVGDTHGTYHVVLPLAPIDEAVAGFISGALLWTAPLAVITVLIFVVVLRRIFSKPMNAMIERVKEIAAGDGDLTQRVVVKSEDEVGQLGKWINLFIEKLHGVICSVQGAATDVAGAATEIAATSDQMAGSLECQQSEVVKISAAIEEMSASASEVAEKAGLASKMAVESGQTANEGGQVVRQTVERMQSIHTAVTMSAEGVKELGRRNEEIGQIISVINDIADQTNLLALNAAIEAARAGEHGRGFAVVADEVRKLAERTTNATNEIAETIGAIQSETQEAVLRMDTGTEEVKVGLDDAARAGESLQAIVKNTDDVAEVIQGIAAATDEQSAAGEEVSRGVQLVSSGITEATEGSKQTAIAVTQLSTKAEQLQELVKRFKLHADDRRLSDQGPPTGTTERRLRIQEKIVNAYEIPAHR